MRVGIVCPYSFDVPGGVQFHIRDLAEHLLADGHDVRVLAPADEDTVLPWYVEGTGRAVPISYNGSVARLAFGPMTVARVVRWLEQGHFDVVHIHEPIAPSLSLLALWAVEGPTVATFHTSFVRSRAMQAAYPMVRGSFEKIHGRIAVSEAARETVITHLGGDAVVIPNGVFVDRFGGAAPDPRWQGTGSSPTLAFLGRLDEPRKGFPVLAAALPALLAAWPQARVLVAGYGDVAAARRRLPEGTGHAVHFLGGISDEEKAALLASVDVYVAPHTGGESFGIVLVEAMAAGAPVVASDLGAFVRVLDAGQAGRIFPTGDSGALAQALIELVGDGSARASLSGAGRCHARRYDWSMVAEKVVAVYETVIDGTSAVAGRGPRRHFLRWTD
ncbi:Phosphatidylinositol alpha-mannosyltransferase [Austwickia chelonae]|uniref:D-inositol 3-phosphate glycosyltransferase n=1 Tax=Austwickia chelonae NBRC 105200 TaxID=1184607 RepID=K6W6R8_9MICO|nr:glycosyltransferase family 4 protein [Austwickia chelonae]GAB77507.1 phosphatidylinositol alpha-mannosyltransferase PimA [Austwickia chelonae NBRC 105200]SEW11735.1 Phosphatidylinositol alpha-mannosyltransferase [Austwickia chelonae]